MIPILAEGDIVLARAEGRRLAAQVGFSASEQALIATAISELARNIVQYARRGEIVVGIVTTGARAGVSVVARDGGPGIPDVSLAMQDGWSTGGGLGLGLPGTRRLMDEFSIVSAPGQGTTVTCRKWRD